MRYAPIAVALMLLSAACSNEDRDASFVSEAQAAPTQPQKDYGWRTTPQYPAAEAQVREVREYQ
jgi:PBP1b-binding outer membrane lipoprotein LpoB